MNEPWAIETAELLLEPPLATSLTPRHYRVIVRTPSGQDLSGITIRTGRNGHLSLHMPSTLLSEVSFDTHPITLPLTTLDHEILRRRLTQILTMNTPTFRHRIATRSPPP